MARKKNPKPGEQRSTDGLRESGRPGGGKGRTDVVGKSGVYPMSAKERPKGTAPIRPMASWGQGERGAAGYEDAGGSELVWRDGQLLGGLTAGAGGAPTIDTHAPLPQDLRTVRQLPRTKSAVEAASTEDEC